MTSEQLAARMVAQMNADPQFGTSAAERIRTDAKLAWLQSQRTSLDVDSLYALVSYGSSPETQRQQRIKAMIIARTWQLRGMTAAFYENLFRARDLRANSKAMNAAADAVDAMEAAHGIVSRPVDEAVLVGAVARALEVA